MSNYKDRIIGETAKVESVTRDFSGMRDALFDIWDKVLNKTCDLREAELAVKAASVICKTVDTEIKVRKLLPAPSNSSPKDAFLLSTLMKHEQ